MTDTPKFICWLDLETTGSDSGDQILEVGMIMTDMNLKELGDYNNVFKLDPAIGMTMAAVVYEMHEKSGLIAESLQAPFTASYYMAEYTILEWFKNMGVGKQRVALAGSGVSHFDRRFIKRDWPNVDERFTYWAYDVGVMRRMFELAGVEIPTGNEDKPHRALADARIHLQDGRRYLQALQSLRNGLEGLHWDRFFSTTHHGEFHDCKICNPAAWSASKKS